MPIPHVAAALVRRTCALLAATSAVLHATLLGHAGPVSAAVMVVMIAGCLYCAYDLWTRGTLRAWVVVALMNLAMIALHTPAPTHRHGDGPVVAAELSTVMGVATALAAVEVAAAATVLYVRTRGRSAGVSGRPIH
jgi:hypothetical protein